MLWTMATSNWRDKLAANQIRAQLCIERKDYYQIIEAAIEEETKQEKSTIRHKCDAAGHSEV